MKTLRAWLLRFTGLLPNARRERELADELESHLQMHIDDNLRAGMTPAEARRQAVLKLGGLESTKQIYRERHTLPFVENFLQDVRFSIRQLRKNPGFTSTAILMLALGMCSAVAIFAFVDAALIKPLPYRNPARLIGVFESLATCPQCPLSYPDYLDWKKLNTVFSSLDAYEHTGFILNTPSGAQPTRGTRVSDGFFRTLGVAPILGRDFYAGEDLPAAPRTVLLSYAAWRQRYGGKPDVLGKTVTLNGDANVIIGVLPPDFHFAPAAPSEFWTTIHAASECDLRRSCHSLLGVARLKDGMTVSTALANVTAIAKQLEKEYPGSNRDQGAAIAPLGEVIVGHIRPILLALLSGAGLLLLIAGVNVASLLLVRSESRRREISVRSALGASRSRLIGQFVTEGLILAAAGGALGLVSAAWAMQLLAKLIPADMLAYMPFSARPRLERPRVGLRRLHRAARGGAVLPHACGAFFRVGSAAELGRRQPRLRGKYLAPPRFQTRRAGTLDRRGALGQRRPARQKSLSPTPCRDRAATGSFGDVVCRRPAVRLQKG